MRLLLLLIPAALLVLSAPDASAQLPLQTADAVVEVGQGEVPSNNAAIFDPPQAQVSDSTLFIELGPDVMTGSASLELSNVASPGAEALAFTAFVRRAIASAVRGEGDNEVFLTQSVSQDIIAGYASVCSPTSTTSYWRLFDLAAEDLDGELDISTVEIGIALTPAVETTLRLYRVDGSLQFGAVTLLFETNVPLDGSEEALLLSVPVDAVIAADAKLAVEWNTPFVPDVGPFIGVNPSGETNPQYRSYPGCFSSDFPPTPKPSAHNHWVLNVRGSVGPAPVVVTPSSDVISAGGSREVVVDVDATDLAHGVHPYELVFLTNDPDQPEIVVELSIAVEAPIVSTAEGPEAVHADLLPAYPNPLTTSSTLSFDLAEATSVQLAVYDIMGRRVAVITDGTYTAGKHTLVWDASSVSAGMYFARLVTDAGATSRRLLVTR